MDTLLFMTLFPTTAILLIGLVFVNYPWNSNSQRPLAQIEQQLTYWEIFPQSELYSE